MASAALVLGLLCSPPRPDYSTWMRVDLLLRIVLGAALFYIILIWPLFLMRREGRGWRLELALMVVLIVPLVVAAAYFSSADAETVVRSVVLLGAIGAAAGASAARLSAPGRQRWYYLIALLLSFFPPFLAYIIAEQLAAETGWLRVISPFWALDFSVIRPDGWWITALISIAVALLPRKV